eukprot:6186001-Pleurochrysis_carterae.AAC.1
MQRRRHTRPARQQRARLAKAREGHARVHAHAQTHVGGHGMRSGASRSEQSRKRTKAYAPA